MFDCEDPKGNKGGGCWRSRVIPLGDNPTLDEHPCLKPVIYSNSGETSYCLPSCMEAIKPEMVANLILRYNEVHEANVKANERRRSLPLRLPNM